MEEEKKTNNKEIKKKLWKSLPLKYKLIIIGCIIGFIINVLFIVVMITPLIKLDIIDISGIGNNAFTGDKYESFDSSTMWWPFAGSELQEDSDGNYISNGEPIETFITSDFGEREYKDSKGNVIKGFHNGIDISSNSSDKIYIVASSAGEVVYPSTNSIINCQNNTDINSAAAQCGGGYGNYVKISHENGYETIYAHLYPDSIVVFAGDKVKKGQVIGIMGSSGRSTGAHLHFEVRLNGQAIDPKNYISLENSRPE